MIELEIYAAGVRNLDKILELDHELEVIPDLHYKVDSNHDIVYLEASDVPSFSLEEIQSVFIRMGLTPRIVGAIPAALVPQSKKKTQQLI